MGLALVFETHSMTTDNERGIATGWSHGELSESGRRLAREMGDRRRGDGLLAVFTSDLLRAVETAEIAFGGSGTPVRRDARLRECNYGSLNGTSRSRMEAERSRHIDEPFPGGESYRQVVERVGRFLDELRGTLADGRVMVIGHSATRFALDHLLIGAPLEDLVDAPFNWRPGWLYALETRDGDKAALA